MTGDPISYPRLRHCTFVKRADTTAIRMIVGTEHFDIEPEDGCGEVFLKAKRYFDGRHSIEEICQIIGVSEEDLRALVEQFASLGLFRQATPTDRIPTADFVRQVKKACVMWSRQIGFHKLFGLLETGKADKEVFLGLLIETYHYVNSAARHIAVAISHCTDPAHSDLLSRYLAEEYNHAPLVLQTLGNLGLNTEHVKTSHPNVGTLSLINMLCEIGRQSTLAYIACTSLVEARREDAEKGKESFESIARLYGYDPECLRPLIAHRLADLDAGHEGLLEVALRDHESVDSDEAHLVVNSLHDLKHSFDQFHDQLLKYYTTVTNYIPRIKVDYFSL